MRTASCEGDERSVDEVGLPATGGHGGEQAWKIPLVETGREEKQENMSGLAVLECMVHLGKPRE